MLRVSGSKKAIKPAITADPPYIMLGRAGIISSKIRTAGAAMDPILDMVETKPMPVCLWSKHENWSNNEEAA